MLAEQWARENNFKFPSIDAQMQYEKFGMKEFYVFRDPNDPSCPVVVHFVLVNNKFKEEIKTRYASCLSRMKGIRDFKKRRQRK